MKQIGAWTLAQSSPEAMAAYRTWANQRDRCNRPGNPSYSCYGGKGIRVEYSSLEFVKWYLVQIKLKQFEMPNVGRINHDKNYCFSNIEMVEKSENSRERIRRCGAPAKHPNHLRAVYVIDRITDKIISKYNSLLEAAEATGTPRKRVWDICNGRRPGTRRLRFEYVG